MTRQEAYAVLRNYGLTDQAADDYLAWHALHANIWHAFQRVALAMAAEKGERIASKKIGEKVRDELTKCGVDWALNNNRLAAMGRLFAGKYPQHAHRFQFRALGGFDSGERRAA